MRNEFLEFWECKIISHSDVMGSHHFHDFRSRGNGSGSSGRVRPSLSWHLFRGVKSNRRLRIFGGAGHQEAGLPLWLWLVLQHQFEMYVCMYVCMYVSNVQRCPQARQTPGLKNILPTVAYCCPIVCLKLRSRTGEPEERSMLRFR